MAGKPNHHILLVVPRLPPLLGLCNDRSSCTLQPKHIRGIWQQQRQLSRADVRQLREQAHDMFVHGYSNYMQHAFPHVSAVCDMVAFHSSDDSVALHWHCCSLQTCSVLRLLLSVLILGTLEV